MTEPANQNVSSPSAAGPEPRRLGAALAVLTLLLLAAMVMGYYLYVPSGLGERQPIPFSHRFHVTEKKLSCVFCHGGAINTERAGVPPLETCLLCHRKIIVEYPYIAELRTHYDQNKPIEWVRVNALQEFVYFNHSAHIRAGFDCSKCHGDVAGMDRVYPVQDLNQMGFCVQCHRDENVSHDCLVCHR